VSRCGQDIILALALVDAATRDRAAQAAVIGAKPLTETGYKVSWLAALVGDLPEQVCDAEVTMR
jgi:hypothetical protein